MTDMKIQAIVCALLALAAFGLHLFGWNYSTSFAIGALAGNAVYLWRHKP